MSRDAWGRYLTDEDVAIAKKNGISKNTVEQRINRGGWSVEKAVNKPLRKKIPKKFTLLAEKNGIKDGTFRGRVRRGWTLEDAATKPLITKEEMGRKIGLANKKRRKIPEEIIKLAADNGICYNTLRTRIGRGTPMKKAATLSVVSKRQNRTMYNRGSFDWWMEKEKE